jgi:glycine/D-amino acid oxidase-like deaminating enzyme
MVRSLRERSCWSDTVGLLPAQPPVSLPDRVDVAIVGAGFTGLSAALVLAKRGASVAVLESHTVGWGASSRNGGMALTGLKRPVEWLASKFGLSAARRLYDASIAAIDFVERIVRDESIDCDFTRSGHLEVACKRSHYDGFCRTAEILAHDFKHDVQLVEKQDLASEIASSVYHGGLLDRLSAGLNPARLVTALALRAGRSGAIVAEHTPVTRIERAPRGGTKGSLVTTARGAVFADDILVATGAYTGDATPALRKRIVPVGSYVVATEPLGESLSAELIPRGRMIFDSNNFLHYYRLTPDRRLLFGGRAAFTPATDNTVRESAEILRRGMLRVFPQMRDMALEYAWGGNIDFTFDMLPHVGGLDGVHYALGYAGHGVAMATYLGALMADAIATGNAPPEFDTGLLPQAPLRLSGASAWLLPAAGAWYKFLDWAT